MSQIIRPFLMFQDGQAESATTSCVSPFPDSEILDIERYGAADPGPEGSVVHARFVKHAFGSPS